MSYNIEKKSKSLNDNMIFIVILAIMIFIIYLLMNNSISNNNSNNIKSTNKEINEIINAVNINYDKAIEINNILISIGINSFNSIENDEALNDLEGENSKGYRIGTYFESAIILYLDSNNNVICVRWVNKDYYRDGKILEKFD